MNGFEFEPDRIGIESVLQGPEMALFLTTTARRAADRVENRAPRGFYDYEQNVRAVPAAITTDGIAAAVEVDSPGWHLPEFGTARYPAQAPLRRGVEESGLRLKTGR